MLMAETETKNFTRAGTMFALTTKIRASAVAGRREELYAALKENGCGDLVYETVNANSLSAFVKEQIAENQDTDDGDSCRLLHRSFRIHTDSAGRNHSCRRDFLPHGARQSCRSPADWSRPDIRFGSRHSKNADRGSQLKTFLPCPVPPDSHRGSQTSHRRRLYLLREGDIFPVILSLPTGSLKSFTRYLMRVIPKYKNSNAVVTKFTLKKAVSGTGMSYSQAQFAVERALSPEEYPLIAAMTEQVKALSKNVGYDTEDALLFSV